MTFKTTVRAVQGGEEFKARLLLKEPDAGLTRGYEEFLDNAVGLTESLFLAYGGSPLTQAELAALFESLDDFFGGRRP
jgi:hypothetical protein